MQENDIVISKNITSFFYDKHIEYLVSFYDEAEKYNQFNYQKLNTIYWHLTSLYLLKREDLVRKETIVEFLNSCLNDDGGYGPFPEYGSNITSTLSAIQICITLDILHQLNILKLVTYIISLQQPNGSFSFDEYGEEDMRCTFSAILSLYFLNALNKIQIDLCVEYIQSCYNFDGSFGGVKWSDSHGAMVYCCLGSLMILEKQHIIDDHELGFWLCERQCRCGGLCGRPDKLPDSCYSWWVLSSLFMIQKHDWIDKDKLILYLLACQDEEIGGFADRPDDMVDVFHTFFSICGLSLLQFDLEHIDLINPIVCMPKSIVEKKFSNLNHLTDMSIL